MKKNYEEMTREELIRELHLISLRRQITPHFLFNSLSVAMSLVMQSQKTALKFLRHLAQMYRYLLRYGNEYHVPVEQELEMMFQYYELMSFRHVGSINLMVDAEVKKLKGYPLPPLSMQGLLENAIRHNTHTKEMPLDVHLFIENGEYLVMQNNIVPLITQIESTKRGLPYVNESMKQLFGKEIIVENDGVTFSVRIPLVKI